MKKKMQKYILMISALVLDAVYVGVVLRHSTINEFSEIALRWGKINFGMIIKALLAGGFLWGICSVLCSSWNCLFVMFLYAALNPREVLKSGRHTQLDDTLYDCGWFAMSSASFIIAIVFLIWGAGIIDIGGMPYIGLIASPSEF